MGPDHDWLAHVSIVRSGIDRFVSEGYICWDRENLEKLFHPYSLNDPRVRSLLQDWQNAGAIALPGTEQEFMRVLNSDLLS